MAFNASRFVCSAIEVITLTTFPISCEDAPSEATVAFVDSTAVTACAATRAASLADWAISRIDAPISSAPAETVCTFRDTCSAAAETTPACTDVSSAPPAMCCEDAASCSNADATAAAEVATPSTTERTDSCATAKDRAI